MTDIERCAEIRELLPELALGVASGEVRARLLAHLAGCPACQRELAEVSGTVDDLLALAPEHEPPLGFEGGVLAALDSGGARRPVRTMLLAAAAAVLVALLGAGVARWHDADDRSLADEYRHVLSVAHGSYLRAADLRSGQSTMGNVFAYQGKPSWIFVAVHDAPSGSYHVRVVTADGSSRWIGRCDVRGGSGSWGTTVAVPIRAVDRLEMYGNGLPTITARFSA